MNREETARAAARVREKSPATAALATRGATRGEMVVKREDPANE
jgi:hypothetical protein